MRMSYSRGWQFASWSGSRGGTNRERRHRWHGSFCAEHGSNQSLGRHYTRTIVPARALAAEIQTLERTLSDLVNQAYDLTPAEIDLMWKTAPPRMPVPPPRT